MAISKLKARHAKGKRTVAQTIKECIAYNENPDKTDAGKWVAAYACQPETAHEEFMVNKEIYSSLTGRKQPKERDVISYFMLQSFPPEEVSAQQAHTIGYELAMAFTKGQHQFVVSTHIDKEHIHNHIEFNSTNIDCTGKFHLQQSARVLQKLNDEICEKYGCSILQNHSEKGKQYGEWREEKQGTSYKANLKNMIERLLPACNDLEELLAKMRDEGYEIKKGKYISFRAAGQERFTRGKTIGKDYTEEKLRKRIARQKSAVVTSKNKQYQNKKKVNLLVDIAAKLEQGKGKGYERWAKIFNLKEAAKTLNFLTEKGITNYEALVRKSEETENDFNIVSDKIKSLEKELTDIANLKKHIINYSKTRDVYVAYKHAKNKKKFMEEHREELELHKDAKTAFNTLKMDKIPKVAELQEEYMTVLSDKKEAYAQYKNLRKGMLEFKTTQQNIECILQIDEQKMKEKEQKNEER